MHKRPINLNLFNIRFPITALVSIGHRLSGVWLFLMIPVLLEAFAISVGVSSRQDFWAPVMVHPAAKFLLWTVLVAGTYHVLAGLRHLLMDIGYGEHLPSAKLSARLVIGTTLICAVFIGYQIW